MEDYDQQSGAIIGSNDDLLTEILLRLPVTSIFSFKSVSKHWQWLLSHSHFIRMHDNLLKSPGFFTDNIYVPYDVKNQSMHDNLSKSPDNIYVQHDVKNQSMHDNLSKSLTGNIIYAPYDDDVENRSTPPFSSLDFCFDPYGIRIVQSCNGLLLCCSNAKMADRQYYVYNPTTKQFAIIKEVPGGYDAQIHIFLMGLAYHQTECVCYKVVCISILEPPHQKLFQIQIYSSDTRKWKVSVESFYMDWPSFFCQGVYFNGAIHWTPSYHNHLYFNIETEQLRILPLPVQMTKTRRMYFGESRGHLHSVILALDHDDKTLDVYEMLSDCSGCFVKYQVDLHELWGAFPEMTHSPYDFKQMTRPSSDFNVVDVVRGEKEEDTFIVLKIPGSLIRYNVHDKSFKMMFNVTRYNYRRYAITHRYIETLASF